MAKGIADLAEKLGLEQHVVRAKLRSLGVDKAGENKRYEWPNDKDLDAIAKRIREIPKGKGGRPKKEPEPEPVKLKTGGKKGGQKKAA